MNNSRLRRFAGSLVLASMPLLGLPAVVLADPGPVGPVGPVGGCPGGMNWDAAINQCVATPVLGPVGVGPVGPGPVGPGV